MKKQLITLAAIFSITQLPPFGGTEGGCQNISINVDGTPAATANMLEVTQTSATGGKTAIYAGHSGATAGTGYGLYATKTGASTTNVGGFFNASGGTNNYAILVPSGGGRVGIGNIAPTQILDVTGNGLFSDHVGIGTTVSGKYPLNIYEDAPTEVSGENHAGIYSDYNRTGSFTNTSHYGAVFIMHDGSGATLSSGALRGIYSGVSLISDIGAVAVSKIDGIITAVELTEGPGNITVTDLKLCNLSNFTNTGTAAITTMVGVDLPSAFTGATTAISLRSPSAAAMLHTGSVRIGSQTAPTVALDVTGAGLFSTTLKSSGATSGIGYATGAGGTVTQATSKSTGVTLNNVCGAITMQGAALAAGAVVSFTVTNSAVAATDVPVVAIASGGTANAYTANVVAVAAGSFTIQVKNVTGGSLSESPVINFSIIKAVTN